MKPVSVFVMGIVLERIARRDTVDRENDPAFAAHAYFFGDFGNERARQLLPVWTVLVEQVIRAIAIA